MADLFDFSRCPNPPASPQKIADYTVVHDCTVPDVPAPIYQCRRPGLGPVGPVGPAGFDTFGGRIAVTGALGLTPYDPINKVLGSGAVTFQHIDATTGQLVDDYTGTAYTDSTSGVPGNTQIHVKWAEGVPVADVVPCGSGVYA